jgi:hypothetical protein
LAIRRLLPPLLASAVALAGLSALAGSGTASAATAWRGWYICKGSDRHPGSLSGHHRGVLVRGLCEVNAGPAVVRGSLIVSPRSTLVAAYARNDVTGHGDSNLTVGGSLIVKHHAALILGCAAATFPCLDDPDPDNPTLGSTSSVAGNLIASHPLGVVVHGATIGTSVRETGGGGGRDCTPKGIFAKFGSPVYSDYEDTFVGRDFKVTGLRSCWYGTLRDNLRGNALVARNKLADPDATEVISNKVRGSLKCYRNSPAVQFGDSGGNSNRVRGHAAGQCGFHVLQPNPAPTDTTPGGPLQHISVHMGHHHHF